MPANPYVTPEAIRLFLLDRASDNFLLDEEQFKDESMALAITMTVDRFNTTDPFIIFFDESNFPFRSQLILGVTAQLLRMKALNMVRNRVDYATAGGVTVDEKKVAETYLQLAEKLMAEFDSQIRKMKMQINIDQGYGGLGSAYSTINLGGGL